MAVEYTSDFLTVEWAQQLVRDPDWRPVPTYSTQRKPPPNTENSLLARTLWNASCIRAVTSFHKGNASASSPLANETRMLFSLGDGVHGHSGFSHGGFTGMMMDEVTGQLAATVYGRGIFTVELSLKYKKMLPTPGVVLCRAWIEKEPVGRKVWILGSIEDGQGTVYATGEALFIKEREKL
ncbi:thioesterase superfamily protein [Rutstroemia sp. NJR-2017a BVV2]|nr:thioesterase superfamily protein [Rutstroemia sp. NJR-2017a BVV2]